MSYNDSAFYVAETFLKNRLDALLKPIVGKLSDGNTPLIRILHKEQLVIFITVHSTPDEASKQLDRLGYYCPGKLETSKKGIG